MRGRVASITVVGLFGAMGCADDVAAPRPVASLPSAVAMGDRVGSQATAYYGEVTDASGDAGTHPAAPGLPPDLVFASVSAANGNACFSVRFAPGVFSPSVTLVGLGLDTDQNPATGHPGVDSNGLIDASIIGNEYVMNLGTAFYGTQAPLFKYIGPPINTFAFVGSFPVTFVANGLDLAFLPLTAIGNDDGQLNFKLTSAVQIAPTGFSSILDIMPNAGLAAGSTSVVTVTPTNRVPVAVADNAQTTSPNAVTVAVLANDKDCDGDPLVVSTVTQPTNGTAAVSGGGQTVTYTPTAGFSGQDQFTYSISDGRGGTASASVGVSVAPAPAPSADLVLSLTNEVEANRIRLRVTQRNLGPSPSAGASVFLQAPRGLRLLSVQGGICKGDLTATAITFNCVRPALPVGGQSSMVIVFATPGPGSYAFAGKLTGLTPDPNLANNVASTTAIRP